MTLLHMRRQPIRVHIVVVPAPPKDPPSACMDTSGCQVCGSAATASHQVFIAVFIQDCQPTYLFSAALLTHMTGALCARRQQQSNRHSLCHSSSAAVTRVHQRVQRQRTQQCSLRMETAMWTQEKMDRHTAPLLHGPFLVVDGDPLGAGPAGARLLARGLRRVVQPQRRRRVLRVVTRALLPHRLPITFNALLTRSH